MQLVTCILEQLVYNDRFSITLSKLHSAYCMSIYVSQICQYNDHNNVILHGENHPDEFGILIKELIMFF